MKNYYADSSFIIDLMNDKESAVEKLEEINNLVTGVPIIYELNKFPDFNSNFTRKILELTIKDVEKAGETWRKLNSDGERIGEIDHLIAGQVINRNMTLVTRDKDFEKIEKLEVEYFR